MHRRIPQVLDALKRSKFRSRFRLSGKERQYFSAKGAETIRSHARDFILHRVAPAAPRNDGRQTPMRGHPVFVAQHATATCCRGCIRKWHRIEKGTALTDEQVEFLVEVIMEWLRREMNSDPHDHRPSAKK